MQDQVRLIGLLLAFVSLFILGACASRRGANWIPPPSDLEPATGYAVAEIDLGLLATERGPWTSRIVAWKRSSPQGARGPLVTDLVVAVEGTVRSEPYFSLVRYVNTATVEADWSKPMTWSTYEPTGVHLHPAPFGAEHLVAFLEESNQVDIPSCCHELLSAARNDYSFGFGAGFEDWPEEAVSGLMLPFSSAAP